MSENLPKKVINRKIVFTLWLLCIVGSLSVLPYVRYLGILPSETSIWRVLLFAALQAAAVFGFVCWASSKILPKTDLSPFIVDNPFKRIILPALVSGILVGLILFLSDKTIFASSALVGKAVHPPMWAGALASIYGAVNEEVLCRLFLFTLVYFVLSKGFKNKSNKRLTLLWSATILVALLFGVGHLPAAFDILSSPSAFEICRILFLNGIAGIVFGWLYWSRGLWTAMAAHFVTDLMIHVFLI